MLETERWAIPFDHLFYRDGVDESNPGALKMEAQDVIGEFYGGVLTENGDTVMIAELDFELDIVKKVVADTNAYRTRIEKQLADGIPQEELEKPPYGFSPQAELRFTDEDAVIDKNFKNISLVQDPEYGAEGAVLHGIGFTEEHLLRDLATNFVSKDAYVSPNFGAKLWSYRNDTRPPPSYIPQVLIPIEDPVTPSSPLPQDNDPMDEDSVEVPPEAAESAVEENDPMHIDPAPERPGESFVSNPSPLSVYSSRGESDPSAATEEQKSSPSSAEPQHVAKSGTLTNSSNSVSPALVNTPTMSQPEQPPVTDTDPMHSQSPDESHQSADPPSSSSEPTDAAPPVSVPSTEDREQERARSAEKAEDFFKRAQQRQRDMNTIQSDSDRLAADAGALLKEMDSSAGLIDFTRVATLLQRYQTIDTKIDELNLGRKEVPKSYTIATAKANDVLSRWNEEMNSAAKKNDMEDDLPAGMDVMMDEPKVLRANQQILKVFSKSLRRTSRTSTSPPPTSDNTRINQREIEERAEVVRRKKQEERKRPRDDDEYVNQSSTSADEKKRKVNAGLVELPRSRVIGVFSSKVMDVTVQSNRYNNMSDFPVIRQRSAVTVEEDAIRQRWIRLAQRANI